LEFCPYCINFAALLVKYSYYGRLVSNNEKMVDVYRYNEKKGIIAGPETPAETEEIDY